MNQITIKILKTLACVIVHYRVLGWGKLYPLGCNSILFLFLNSCFNTYIDHKTTWLQVNIN